MRKMMTITKWMCNGCEDSEYTNTPPMFWESIKDDGEQYDYCEVCAESRIETVYEAVVTLQVQVVVRYPAKHEQDAESALENADYGIDATDSWSDFDEVEILEVDMYTKGTPEEIERIHNG